MRMTLISTIALLGFAIGGSGLANAQTQGVFAGNTKQAVVYQSGALGYKDTLRQSFYAGRSPDQLTPYSRGFVLHEDEN